MNVKKILFPLVCLVTINSFADDKVLIPQQTAIQTVVDLIDKLYIEQEDFSKRIKKLEDKNIDTSKLIGVSTSCGETKEMKEQIKNLNNEIKTLKKSFGRCENNSNKIKDIESYLDVIKSTKNISSDLVSSKTPDGLLTKSTNEFLESSTNKKPTSKAKKFVKSWSAFVRNEALEEVSSKSIGNKITCISKKGRWCKIGKDRYISYLTLKDIKNKELITIRTANLRSTPIATNNNLIKVLKKGVKLNSIGKIRNWFVLEDNTFIYDKSVIKIKK